MMITIRKIGLDAAGNVATVEGHYDFALLLFFCGTAKKRHPQQSDKQNEQRIRLNGCGSSENARFLARDCINGKSSAAQP